MTKDTRRYYATMTLLGGDPDINRRMIYYGAPRESGRLVACFNVDMRPWTPELAVELEACLAALNNLPKGS
jgi:hypothetical protein